MVDLKEAAAAARSCREQVTELEDKNRHTAGKKLVRTLMQINMERVTSRLNPGVSPLKVGQPHLRHTHCR